MNSNLVNLFRQIDSNYEAFWCSKLVSSKCPWRTAERNRIGSLQIFVTVNNITGESDERRLRE
jgi:hypothetical protein